jgi:hypothetical protein
MTGRIVEYGAGRGDREQGVVSEAQTWCAAYDWTRAAVGRWEHCEASEKSVFRNLPDGDSLAQSVQRTLYRVQQTAQIQIQIHVSW